MLVAFLLVAFLLMAFLLMSHEKHQDHAHEMVAALPF